MWKASALLSFSHPNRKERKLDQVVETSGVRDVYGDALPELGPSAADLLTSVRVRAPPPPLPILRDLLT